MTKTCTDNSLKSVVQSQVSIMPKRVEIGNDKRENIQIIFWDLTDKRAFIDFRLDITERLVTIDIAVNIIQNDSLDKASRFGVILQIVLRIFW